MGEKSIEVLIEHIVQFRDERDWGQFHTPRNVSVALSIEVAELLELFLWEQDAQIQGLLELQEFRDQVRRELADILIYTLLLFNELDLSPSEAVQKKIAENRIKYPVAACRGKSIKYTKLENQEGAV